MPSFIVSTSYEQYIAALCSLTQFPYENVYCTRLDLDRFTVSGEEIERVKRLREEIAKLPMIEIPAGSKSLEEFSLRDRETVRRLDAVFWEEMLEMGSGRLLVEVNPVGGHEKARAVEDIVGKRGVGVRDVVYVGDSITDSPPLRLVREEGGLAVSFNGNAYAVREAEVAVLSGNALVTAVLADCFGRFGREDAVRLVEEWSQSALERYCVDDTLRGRFLEVFPDKLPKVEVIGENNKDRLVRESSSFRKTVRGEAIGGLG
jgi:energy-converting hydrogenase A subunit R